MSTIYFLFPFTEEPFKMRLPIGAYFRKRIAGGKYLFHWKTARHNGINDRIDNSNCYFLIRYLIYVETGYDNANDNDIDGIS